MKTFISMALLVVYFIIFFFIQKGEKDSCVEYVRNQTYFGMIDTLYLDKESRDQLKAKLNSGDEVFIENPIHGIAKVHDTIYKDAGSFKHFLIHQGDTTLYYVSYLGDEIK